MAHDAARCARMQPIVLASLLATWFVWGSTYLAIKWALPSFPPYFQMGTRFLAAGALMLAWSRGVRKAPLPTRVQWRNAFVVGSLMLGCGMGGTAVAELSIGSGLVVVFIAVTPMMIAAVNRLYGVRVGRLESAGIAAGLAGVVLLTQGAGFRASPAGLAAISIACAGWSIGSVLSQRSLPLAEGAMGHASQMLCGSAVLLSISWLTGEAPRWPPTPLAALSWFYLMSLGSLVAFNAYMLLLERTSVALATSYSFVNPVIAMILGVAVGGESITAREWLAAAIVLIGVSLLLWQRRQPAKAQ